MGTIPASPSSLPADYAILDSHLEQVVGANAIIQDYLMTHLPIYRDLDEIRRLGWASEEGDSYFTQQRQRADKADGRTKEMFFKLMCAIGFEMDKATSALTIRRAGEPQHSVLDLCMAPGGYSAAALKRNHPSTRIRGISLPPEQGGHEIKLCHAWSTTDLSAQIFVDFRDITLLAEEMGVPLSDIPCEHPDVASFSSDRPFSNQKFDLVFCDGQVLRTHDRGEHRETHEAVRLLTSQLVLALQRIRSGGNMVILLHKADIWSSVQLIYTFSRFSDTIALFKPTKGHRARSSFYLVAKGVRPERDAGVEAVGRWKAQWKIATFGEEAMSEREWEVLGRREERDIEVVLREFGSELLRLTAPVFVIQEEALRNAPWMKRAMKAGEGKRRGKESTQGTRGGGGGRPDLEAVRMS